MIKHNDYVNEYFDEWSTKYIWIDSHQQYIYILIPKSHIFGIQSQSRRIFWASNHDEQLVLVYDCEETSRIFNFILKSGIKFEICRAEWSDPLSANSRITDQPSSYYVHLWHLDHNKQSSNIFLIATEKPRSSWSI